MGNKLVYQQRLLPVVTYKLNIVQLSVFEPKSLVRCFVQPVNYVLLLQIIVILFIFNTFFQENNQRYFINIKAYFKLKYYYETKSHCNHLSKNLARGSSPDLSLKLHFNYFCTYQFPPRKSTWNRRTSLNPKI